MSAIEHLPVDAVVLAAGFGRRLGYPKAALRLKDQWILPKLVHALERGGARKVFVVLSPTSEQAIEGFGHPGGQRLLNPEPESGRTGTLQRALQEIALQPPQGLLVHPCDVPLLLPDAVTALLRAWNKQKRPSSFLARPVTAAGRGGHPLLIGADFFPELAGYAPDQSLRDLLHRHRDKLLDVKYTADPGPFLDVDTEANKQWLESLLDPASDDAD
ncbi:MAG: nucleotidyltransferase family protein [Planctomycetota bacterium]|nr:MAG: nucleotidyltransferase family protein [Planctomycetota bacterium]